MIHDRIQNISRYIDEPLSLVVVGLIDGVKEGRCNTKVEIAGSDVYANIFEMRTGIRSNTKIEAHRVYCDIHIIVKGEEFIDTYDTSILEPDTAYDSS